LIVSGNFDPTSKKYKPHRNTSQKPAYTTAAGLFEVLPAKTLVSVSVRGDAETFGEIEAIGDI